MKRQAWRIVKAKYAGTAFNGEGAFRAGGRWNSRWHRAVYCSSTLSLAALETLVHIIPMMDLKHAVCRITFDERMVESVNQKNLPINWREQPPPMATQSIGDQWIKQARSAVLKLPSIIIPHEYNYILNPTHPDFNNITTHPFESFAFDPRLLP